MNFFLDQIADKTDEESLRQRAEVRFLRALHYWYFLDLFGKAPFKEHFDNELPTEKNGQELYNYIAQELEASEDDLYEPGQAPFGRADKAANWLLHARLCLNAEVYTGTARWNECLSQCNDIINSGKCDLSPEFKDSFRAQGVESSKEVLFTIPYDYNRGVVGNYLFMNFMA